MPVEDLENKDHFGFTDEELASIETNCKIWSSSSNCIF